MVTVCAWCERYLGASPEPVTHGICPACASRQQWSETPVLVVSRDRAFLRDVLEHLLQGEPAIRVVVDRRAAERRRNAADIGAGDDRRREPDRRRRRADAFLA